MGNGVKSKTIMFKNQKDRQYIGRNGRGWQNGLEIWSWNDADSVIKFVPINSKNQSAHCMIELPKEHLQEFINKLQTFL